VNKQRILSSLLIQLVCVMTLAQTPDWVQGMGKSLKYPETLYLTGYGVASLKGARDQAGESATANARKNLIEKVRITIQAVTSSKTEEMGDKYSSFFASAVQSTSTLDIQGLESATFADDEFVHAFVYVKREIIESAHRQKVASLRQEIAGKLAAAQSLDQAGKVTQALDEFVSCYPFVRQLEEAQSLLAAVASSNPLNDLQNYASTNEITVATIRDAVQKLIQRPIRTIEDLAWVLVYQMKEQTGKTPGPLTVTVLPCVYQDTKLGSPFSRYFKSIVEQRITELVRWNVLQEGQAAYILSGSYWEQKDIVRFVVTLRSVADGRICASAEATIDSKIMLASGHSVKPANYRVALADQKTFAGGEIAGGGLTLEAWTNKQTQGNLFTGGEKMKVLVRVNMPCYIRFIYHMADGKRVLLLDEYFMDASKVNLAYEIPQEFECAAPFGAEVLQLFARTEKFERMNTQRVDGYDYIRGDLKNVVTGLRGMKAAKPKTMQAEQRIVVTTMNE
jgi:hypothetical protein